MFINIFLNYKITYISYFKKKNEILIISNSFWSVYNFRSGFVKEFIKNKNNILISSLKDNNIIKLKKLGAKTKSIKIISKAQTL